MMEERLDRYKSAAVVIIYVALLFRIILPLAALIVAGDLDVFKAPDTDSYLRCAESMARGDGFSSGGKPEIARTPGYPLLLIPGVLHGNSAGITVMLQVALGGLTVWLVYRLVLELSGRSRAAFAAALLMAFEPLSVLYSSLMLAETLFTAMLTLFIYLFVLYLSRRRPGLLVAASLALAGAVYVRPVAYWLPLVMAVFLVAAGPGKSRGRGLTRALSFICICAVCLGAWQLRNRRETGYGGFSSISDYYLYFYQGAAVLAAENGKPYYEVQREMGYNDPELYRARHPGRQGLTRPERLAAMGRDGWEIIRAHPRTFARIYAMGMARTLLDPGAIGYLKLFRVYPEGTGLLGAAVDRGPVSAVRELARTRPLAFWSNVVLGVVLGAYLLLASLGIFRWGRCGLPFAAVLAVGVYILILSGGANALARFRHPLMPIICILAGCGLDFLFGGKKRTITNNQ